MKWVILVFVCVGVVMASEGSVGTNDTWYAPDRYLVQYAGHQGVVSVGVGYGYFTNHLYGSISYGYTPKALGGVSVHSVAIKGRFEPVTINVGSVLGSSIGIVPHVAVNTIVSPQYDVIVNDRFRSYYWPSGIRIGYYTGLSVLLMEGVGVVDELGFSVSAGTLQSYLLYAFENESIGVLDVTSLSLELYFSL
ncbi:MAG: hypothetical protein OCC49_10745 [Fibrobacterales bacterium]